MLQRYIFIFRIENLPFLFEYIYDHHWHISGFFSETFKLWKGVYDNFFSWKKELTPSSKGRTPTFVAWTWRNKIILPGVATVECETHELGSYCGLLMWRVPLDMLLWNLWVHLEENSIWTTESFAQSIGWLFCIRTPRCSDAEVNLFILSLLQFCQAEHNWKKKLLSW